MAALLDVNALIALLDADHVGHQDAQSWFRKNHRSGWATCPITENGVVRVLSQPSYPSGQRTPAEVVGILSSLKRAFSNSHEFWPDDASLTDPSTYSFELIAGTRQVTDAYLLGLVFRRKATLVSFDRSLPWQAIRGATPRVVHQLP